MKECLWCKKEFQEKKTTAKYCSTSCRVMWCNKNKKQKAKVREDVLMNMISEMNKKLLMQIENVTFPPIQIHQSLKDAITDKPIYKYPLEEKDVFKPQEKTIQQFLNEISELEFEPEYKAKRLEIEQSSLTTKQKELLYSNMRSSKM